MTGQGNRDAVTVGADGSWQSQKAVEAATREAARRGAGLVVLAVARAEGTASGLADLRRLEEDALESARACAKRSVDRARATDPEVAVQAVVLASPDASGLRAVIDRTQLLVLGGHGRRGQAAFSIGSTSGDLARRFGTPVLLPRLDGPPAGAPARHPEVHVGVSGHGDESDLLRLAAVEAGLRGSALRVIRAVPGFPAGQGAAHPEQELEQTWRAVHAVPECAEVPCHVEVVQDDPVAALLARCAADDLLVVGTRGGGTLAGLVSGSVARGILDGLVCDVVVVPPEARTRDSGQSTRSGPRQVSSVSPR
jgi:nucleotide-binding universal stress UspA family protein